MNRAVRLFEGGLLALVLSACAASNEPRVIGVPALGARPVARLDFISDYRAALATVTTIFERDLGFAPFPVSIQFYVHRGAFEKALLEAGYDPALARNTAATMVGIGGYRKVLLNEASLGEMPWAERVLLIAHELAHSLQYELGGGRRGASEQWLREGFAEWVAIRVVERLHAVSFADVRRQRQADLRRAGPGSVPRLAEMSTFPQWVTVGRRFGTTPYAQSFLAVDFLVERRGLAAVLGYFERFATSEDRAGNFRAAFGEDLESFEAALGQRLWPKRP